MKSKKRAKKPAPLPSFKPWRCVVLAVDTGENSGWSIWVLGECVAHGEFNIYTDDGVAKLIEVVECAKMHAQVHKVSWVAVFERPWGGHMGLDDTAAFGYWLFACRNAQLPRSRVGKVYPATWRARILPKGMHAAKRNVVQDCEQLAAAALTGKKTGVDESPGILIGKWGTKAGEVGEMLPKNERLTV